nr:nitric oxide synthase oxygenase [Kibdelosporangium sp. MJ126-NF4]CEL21772.1 Nitric oxide synthase oxygenase [Kibdelosporangium sp. MJ126-NF4]CTQ92552.1 Nitric oxide synthase oxygenase (EC 1.-.-.-) [Kibdelosporangium sp. MJ126-NF4]
MRNIATAISAARDEAEVFLDACARELSWSRQRLQDRWHQVQHELAETGTYRHTREELEFGAKLAWRNHTRCIGKLHWRTLTVRDRRELRTPDVISMALVDHLRWSYNDGQIRPLITVFAQDTPLSQGPRIISHQLVRYAGYGQPDGTVVGDPANANLTARLQSMGWQGQGGQFDRLPVLLCDSDGRLTCHTMPPEVSPDVLITHPDYPWFAELGLRWYAYPTVSDMRLEIGGVNYPAAPFSGWYVGPEIGARNFGDTNRYNLLPTVARKLGLEMERDRTLWKDRALLELNIAVLSSFEAAGVRMLDHHTMTDQFHRYVQTQRRGGTAVHADWSWIVPPMAGSTTPVYHQAYDSTTLSPNFFRD